MQTLGIVPRLFPLVVSGEKTSTIRWRERPIAPGYLTYVCDGDPTRRVVVWVTKATSMPLSEAARFVGMETEWPDAVMLAGMREHYPEIELADTVRVIQHLTPDESGQRADYPIHSNKR